jgi:sensor c-di-GMP phosphodiesterase-like protein
VWHRWIWVGAVSPRQRKFLAIFAGVLLLGLPTAVFNYQLNGVAERQSQEEMNFAARRTISLAESRFDRAVALLDDLAGRGINSCDPAHLDALRQATFATTPVKELSIISAEGDTLCSDLSGPLEARTVISSEQLIRGRNLLLDVVRLGDRPGQIVRIYRPGDLMTNGLAALIPTELFIPQLSNQGGPLGIQVRIATRSGTVIGQNAPLQEEGKNPNDFFSVTLQSDRYAIDVALSLPLASLDDKKDELRILGTIITGVFSLIIFAFVLAMPKRQRDNPIAAIEKAINAGEIVPYYQPVVDIRTGQLRGAEVLARWSKPDGSVVLPGAFIPLIESSGLIIDLTRVLMRQVCKDLATSFERRPHLKIGFNLTARHFADEQVVADVSEIFKNSTLRLSQIVLEMTERQPIENFTETRAVISALQGLGTSIAIDDVGTGHGGLSYMLKLGVDIIKIDKMFVDSIGIDRNATAIVETLIDLAKNLRMEIVAEGVENFEQVMHLRNLGIAAAQGNVFAPPLPCSLFLQLVEALDAPLKKAAEDEPSEKPAGALPRLRTA